MAITVYIHANDHSSFEISDDAAGPLANDSSRLSSEEFKAVLDRLAAKAMKFDGTDVQPLSDYAMSRESIYEDHPKL